MDGSRQRFDKSLAALVIVENVGAESNRPRSRFDRLEHCRKGRVSVDERLDLVALCQLLGNHSADGAREYFEMFGVRMFRLDLQFRHLAAEGAMHPERNGPAAD